MASVEEIKVQNAVAWAAMVRVMSDAEINLYMAALLKSGIHEAALKKTLAILPQKRVKQLYELIAPVIDDMMRRLKTVSRLKNSYLANYSRLEIHFNTIHFYRKIVPHRSLHYCAK